VPVINWRWRIAPQGNGESNVRICGVESEETDVESLVLPTNFVDSSLRLETKSHQEPRKRRLFSSTGDAKADVTARAVKEGAVASHGPQAAGRKRAKELRFKVRSSVKSGK